MPLLQAVHGRIVDLRRHTNVRLYGRRPLGPADRYELWIKPPDGVNYARTAAPSLIRTWDLEAWRTGPTKSTQH